MKSLYVIGPADGPFKVGVAADVSQRLAALQTGSPLPLRVWGQRPAPGGYEEERSVHSALTPHRRKGEWFDCPLPLACEVAGIAPPATPVSRGMSARAFSAWLAEMRAPPFHRSQEECMAMLGLTLGAFDEAKRLGGGPMLALACRALLHRLEPYA